MAYYTDYYYYSVGIDIKLLRSKGFNLSYKWSLGDKREGRGHEKPTPLEKDKTGKV